MRRTKSWYSSGLLPGYIKVGTRAWKTLRRESPAHNHSLNPSTESPPSKSPSPRCQPPPGQCPQAVAVWKNQRATAGILKWRCPDPQSYVVSISNIKISSLDFLGREGILVGRRKQDFRGGNAEQRKGLKGKGGAP